MPAPDRQNYTLTYEADGATETIETTAAMAKRLSVKPSSLKNMLYAAQGKLRRVLPHRTAASAMEIVIITMANVVPKGAVPYAQREPVPWYEDPMGGGPPPALLTAVDFERVYKSQNKLSRVFYNPKDQANYEHWVRTHINPKPKE